MTEAHARSDNRKYLCACGKRDVSCGIRQERLAKKHWRIHDAGRCYELLPGGSCKTIADTR